MEPWFEAVKDKGELEKQIFRRGFLEFGQKSRKIRSTFSLGHNFVFRGLVIDDMVALQISPQFDIMKAMESFFEEHSVEEVEGIVRSQANWKEIDEKIISLNDDWETFDGNLNNAQRKVAVMRERIIEMVFYYAERYPEVKNLLKKL